MIGVGGPGIPFFPPYKNRYFYLKACCVCCHLLFAQMYNPGPNTHNGKYSTRKFFEQEKEASRYH